jgi:hypothetical protein
MTSMATPTAGPHGRVGAHWAMSSSFVGLTVARWKIATASTIERGAPRRAAGHPNDARSAPTRNQVAAYAAEALRAGQRRPVRGCQRTRSADRYPRRIAPRAWVDRIEDAAPAREPWLSIDESVGREAVGGEPVGVWWDQLQHLDDDPSGPVTWKRRWRYRASPTRSSSRDSLGVRSPVSISNA